MDRDRRLTGYLRGQTDKVEAPPGFELNNPWRARVPVFALPNKSLIIYRWRDDSIR